MVCRSRDPTKNILHEARFFCNISYEEAHSQEFRMKRIPVVIDANARMSDSKASIRRAIGQKGRGHRHRRRGDGDGGHPRH
jgi:hypothetical protein